MIGLLRTCFFGQSPPSQDANYLSHGITDETISSDADEKDFAQLIYCNGERQAMHAPRGCPAGAHTKLTAGPGGLGAVYGKYHILEPRPAGVSTPSFTLCAIDEDEADEKGQGDSDDCRYVAGCGQFIPSGPTRGSVATASQQQSLGSPSRGGDISASDLSFECAPLDWEPCAFAIIPPAPLSTVFEESDDEECAGPPSAACHSADAGRCSNGRLPHSSLIRGLSAPSCAGSMGSGPGGAPAAAPCTAESGPPLQSMPATAAARTAGRATPTRGSLAACAGAAAQRSGGSDPMAVWYF